MAAPPDKDRLDSWKEIAEYLHRDVSTVMRWARRRGLPVHRVPGGRRHVVFAVPQEIDVWLESAGTAGSASKVRDSWSGGEHQPETFKAKALGETAVCIGGLEPEPPFHPRPQTPRWRRSLLLVIPATAVVAAACIVAVLALGLGKPLRVTSVTISGRQLLALNSGKVIWSYDFGQALRRLQPEQLDRKLLILDTSGEGEQKVILGAPLGRFEAGDLSTDAVYCFSSTGKVLWRHVFADRVHFGGEECGPRWEVRALMATGRGASSSIWCTVCSYPTSVSLVLKIDPNGNTTRYFVNYGHMGCLNELHVPGGPYLLVGGINNEHNEAVLAVLEETRTSGHSPQTGTLSECDTCPQGEPYRYFLFPRSEVIRVTGPPYNGVREIIVTNAQIQVMTTEGVDLDGVTDRLWALYDISGELIPQSVFFSDFYTFAHERLSAQGKIKHTLAACPERLKPITVREWSWEDGWKNIALPPVESRARD